MHSSSSSLLVYVLLSSSPVSTLERNGARSRSNHERGSKEPSQRERDHRVDRHSNRCTYRLDEETGRIDVWGRAGPATHDHE
jgi:hypothetical protein